MIALDTNLLVRLITADDAKQATQVQRYLGRNTSPTKPAFIDHIVLCELCWVLERSYGYTRSEVVRALEAVLEQPMFKFEAMAQLSEALALYARGPADFSDGLSAIRARDAGFAPTVTFDKRAAKTGLHRILEPA
jgi:predicted nucleic-acid-binding protein